MDENLLQRLNNQSRSDLLKWVDEQTLASQAGIPERQLEEQTLSRGILPLRYLRNIGSISIAEQQVLLQSKVAVIGCGGLGGCVLEQLARLGVGQIIAWDFDVFEEHNVNRQIHSTLRNTSLNKVDVVRCRLKDINPAVHFRGIIARFNPQQDSELLRGCSVVVDGLDNIDGRLKLAAVCRELDLPLVHGAVQGWFGQLSTQFPGETTIEKIYARGSDRPDENISTLVFTPFLVASLQAAEVVKILLGRGELLRKRLMLIDLLEMDIDTIEIT